MRATPPGYCGDLRVLDPGKQQQEAQNRFDIDGDQKKRIDVEIHAATGKKEDPRPLAFPVVNRHTAGRQKKREWVSNCEAGPAVMVVIVFPSFRVFEESALPSHP